MSRLVFLLVYRRKSNLFCLLVKRTLKPLTPGEVSRFTVTEMAIAKSLAGERSLFLPLNHCLVPPRSGNLWSPAIHSTTKKKNADLSPLFLQ